MMNLEDLDLRELLSFNPEGGVMEILGERAILINTFAIGHLRRDLIDTLGAFGARNFLTRLGYANGWQTARNVHLNMPDIWAKSRGYAGSKLHSLTGQVGIHHNIRTDGEGEAPLIDSTWNDCYEAEQHLLHLGLSEESVCWTETAFASGYSSYVEGREVVFIEDKCVAKGDATCHVSARFKEKWGPEFESDLVYYKMESSTSLLKDLNEKLLIAEKRLKKKQKQLAFLEKEESPSFIMARSQVMQNVMNTAWRVAKVESTVLITGASGVGKELLARFIHDQSARASRSFVAVNCGALTETLLESELFGHAKGSFTGADRDRVGLFEAAIGGTLFLDEIGEVSPGMQVKDM
jgi:two-component system, NtrC family, response regulator HydG